MQEPQVSGGADVCGGGWEVGEERKRGWRREKGGDGREGGWAGFLEKTLEN